MRVRILRRDFPEDSPRWEIFRYDGSKDGTVASLLDELNYKDDLFDENGNSTGRIAWECSCLQGQCGGCAMLINGKPALACKTFLRDLQGDLLTLEPLSKFPVIRDLVVDRSIIQENWKKAQVFPGEMGEKSNAEYEHQYAAAKCLKCGLCLEVCPNYVRGDQFYGAAFANDCYLALSVSEDDQQEHLKQTYAQHFAPGCSGSLSCMQVCPMQIPTISSIAKMNRTNLPLS